MLCRKCGKRLKEGENFCNVCGYYNNPDIEGFEIEEPQNNDLFDEEKEEDDDYLDEDYEEEREEDDVQLNLINNTNIDIRNNDQGKKLGNFQEERFREAFIGEDYKWVIRRPINIYALLLSWIYFIYRKMYIIGTLGLILTGIIIRLFPNDLIYYIPAVMIISGLTFNWIYRLYIHIRISIIKKKNYGTDDFNIEEICKEKGGVNIIVTLVIFALFLIIMIFTYYSFHLNFENRKFWQENSENKANCESMTKYSNRLLSEKNINGELDEAVCQVRVTNTTKSYDVYFKLKDNNEYKYIYFKDNKTSVEIVGANANLKELQNKNRNNTISREEKELLTQKKKKKSDYEDIVDEAEKEDVLIKKRKNKSEKLNYIIIKDDILR